MLWTNKLVAVTIHGAEDDQRLELLLRALDLDVLGNQPPEDLPAVATNALVSGVESPSLCVLAGTSPRDYQDARDLFRNAVSELDIQIPTETEARWRCARRWAGDLIHGKLSPIEASRLIPREAWEPLGAPRDLQSFAALAWEWTEDPPHRARYEEEMRKAAEELLTSTPPRG